MRGHPFLWGGMGRPSTLHTYEGSLFTASQARTPTFSVLGNQGCTPDTQGCQIVILNYYFF